MELCGSLGAARVTPVIVRINGAVLRSPRAAVVPPVLGPVSRWDVGAWVRQNYTGREIKRLRRLVPFLWGVWAALVTAPVLGQAATGTTVPVTEVVVRQTSLWEEMFDIFTEHKSLRYLSKQKNLNQ